MESKCFSQNIKDILDTMGIIGFNMGFRGGKVEFERRKSKTVTMSAQKGHGWKQYVCVNI